ncbi:hypothetical protein D0Y65_001419 [Glycine soja]|uniref:Uncharacterized protein n=1 Tax=Glycine soja TaxID=3848 RepID=A0A445M2V5_GLYSO|nr:hypothetical protein D0Y65_001419 [Glycine soja]
MCSCSFSFAVGVFFSSHSSSFRRRCCFCTSPQPIVEKLSLFQAVSSSFYRDQTSSSARFRDLEWTVGAGDVSCFFTIVGGVVVVLLCCSALLLPRAFFSTGVWRCGGGALRINNAYLVCRCRRPPQY